MQTTVNIKELPACDFCGAPAQYDAATRFGPWAYMCSDHWLEHSMQKLGTGFGQKLEVQK